MKNGSGEVSYPFYPFVLAVIGVIGFSIFAQYILLRMSASVVYDTREALLQRILATQFRRIEEMGGHKIIDSLKEGVEILSEGLLNIPKFTYSVVTILLCTGYLFYTSLELSLFICVFIIAIIMVSIVFMHLALKHQAKIRECTDKFFYYIQVFSNGGKDLYLNATQRKHFYCDVMLPLFNDIKSKTVKSLGLFIYMDGVISTLVYFMVGSVAFSAHYLFSDISIATAITFVLVVLYLVDPISEVMNTLDNINEINSLDLADYESFKLPEISTSVARVSSLRVESAAFSYGEKQRISGHSVSCKRSFQIGPVTAEFLAGQVTDIIGDNGSGKLTLLKVLTGLYPLKSGTIYLDDSQLHSDFFLHDVILDVQGEAGDDTKINTILQATQVSDFVSVNQGVLSIKELSTGQRKRMALVQAMYESKSFFIFDEWAAEQDPDFKAYFYQTLIPNLNSQNKIVIIISHDKDYFGLADQVVYMEEGRRA